MAKEANPNCKELDVERKIKILGATFSVILFTLFILAGGSISSVFNPLSLVTILGVTWGFMIFKYGEKALKFWWLPVYERSQIAKWSGEMCLHVGVAFTIVGYMQIANGFTDIKSLGPAISVATISLLYSYLCYLFLFLPFVDSKIYLREKN
jgi:flagellar motor component MotA